METKNDPYDEYLKYHNYTLMNDRLPRFIKINTNNTISSNAEQRIRKEYELKTVGKSKLQSKKIIMDYAKSLRGGSRNFRNEKYAYRFLAQSYNLALQPIRRAIIKKRIEDAKKILISITIRFRGWNRSKTGVYILAKEVQIQRTDTILPERIAQWKMAMKQEVMDLLIDSPFDKSEVKIIKENQIVVQDPEPLEWIPIQLGGVMNLDGCVKNNVWCKNRNMCVVDLIQHRYAKRKGFRKKNKDENEIEFWSTHNEECNYQGYEVNYEIEEKGLMNPNKTGYTLNHIKCWCRNNDVNMYCLIDGKVVDTYYDASARKKKNPPLIFELKNNHMYPILDTGKIKQITNKPKKGQKEIKSNSQQEVKKNDMDEHNDEDVIVKYRNKEIWKKCENKCYMDYACEIMARDNLMTYPAKNLCLYNGSLSSFKLGDNKYLMVNDVVPDEECENKTQLINNRNLRVIKNYCEKKDIHFTGQSAPFFVYPYIKDLFKYYSSYFSKSVCDALLKKTGIKFRTHYGVVNRNKKLWKNTLCYDINKCYRAVMENPSEQWLTIDFNQEEQKFSEQDYIDFNNTKKVPIGLYYVKTQDNTLFHYSNWYSSGTINYVIEKTDIEFTIMNKILGQGQDKSLLKNIIDQIKKDYIDIGLQKLLINSIYGYLMKTHNSKTLMNVDEDLQAVWKTRLLIQGQKNEKLQYDEVKCSNGKTLYCYGRKYKTAIMNQNLAMAIQITDQANIKLYEMTNKMYGKNSVLLYRNTDSAVVGFIDKEDKEISQMKMEQYVNKDVGGYSLNFPPLLQDVRNEREQFYREVYWKHNPYEWKKNNDLNDSDKWIDIIKSLVDKGGGMLLGRAGTGKSFVCIKGMEALEKAGTRCKAIAFTNKATIQLDGETIHHFLRIDKNGKLNTEWAKEQGKKLDVIFVDEISMVSSDLWKILTEFKILSGITFILIGDFRQLPPVKDLLLLGNSSWFNHSSVKYLANFNQIELTEMKRYDKKLWNLLEDIWENNGMNSQKFLKNITKRTIQELVERKNICYSNNTRKIINIMVQQEIRPKYTGFTQIKYKGLPNKYNQDIMIFKGAKFIMYYTTKCKTLKKNEEVEVVNYGDNFVELTNYGNVDNFKITWKSDKEFHKKFLLGYATTIHKSQGDTIDGKVNIFDIEMIQDWLQDKRALYTALSRAKSLKNIIPSCL